MQGKELALERAKLDRSITERQVYTTKLRDKALKREVSAVSAFSTIAAEVYAQTSGITDEARRKKYISGFTSSLGLPTLNAILAV